MVSPEGDGIHEGRYSGLMLREGKYFVQRRESEGGEGWVKVDECPYHSLD